jgi:hypothetical protein
MKQLLHLFVWLCIVLSLRRPKDFLGKSRITLLAMRSDMNMDPLPQSEIIIYQTEDGRTRIQCRFENETLWLTQKQLADLFQIGVNTVNHHLKEIFSERELQPGATIRRYRIVQTEGSRQITREVDHYNLKTILAVGYRVRSHRGTKPVGRVDEPLRSLQS